jgi:hypothetical protein
VSGNTVCLDIDDPGLFRPWRRRVEAAVPGLIGRLVIVRTPGPGYQAWFRSEAPAPGSQVLARRRQLLPDGSARVMTLIETRGEGGYAIVPPSPPECHPNRVPYQLLQGDLARRPVLTVEEQAVLFDAARALNEWIEPAPGAAPRAPAPAWGGVRPGDAYTPRGSREELLRRHGWQLAGCRGAVELWRRPGKEQGHSATLNGVAPGVFYVFSTNAHPFQPGRAYDLFGAYALLEHAGQYSEAARALRRLGFGD